MSSFSSTQATARCRRFSRLNSSHWFYQPRRKWERTLHALSQLLLRQWQWLSITKNCWTADTVAAAGAADADAIAATDDAVVGGANVATDSAAAASDGAGGANAAAACDGAGGANASGDVTNTVAAADDDIADGSTFAVTNANSVAASMHFCHRWLIWRLSHKHICMKSYNTCQNLLWIL